MYGRFSSFDFEDVELQIQILFILDLLADMLSLLINSEPLVVSKAIVDSEGIAVIRKIMECSKPGKAQLSMLSIIADIATGENEMREQLSDIVCAIVPAAEIYLKALGIAVENIEDVEEDDVFEVEAAEVVRKKERKRNQKKNKDHPPSKNNLNDSDRNEVKVEEEEKAETEGGVNGEEETSKLDEVETKPSLDVEEELSTKEKDEEAHSILVADAFKGLNFVACTVNRLSVLNENRENM